MLNIKFQGEETWELWTLALKELQVVNLGKNPQLSGFFNALAKSFLCVSFIYSYMSMMNEIEKFMSGVETSFNYRIVNLGGHSLYIEGIKSVVSFDDLEMRFQLKGLLLIVKGERLKVDYLDKTTCTISGAIKAVEVQWNLN